MKTKLQKTKSWKAWITTLLMVFFAFGAANAAPDLVIEDLYFTVEDNKWIPTAVVRNIGDATASNGNSTQKTFGVTFHVNGEGAFGWCNNFTGTLAPGEYVHMKMNGGTAPASSGHLNIRAVADDQDQIKNENSEANNVFGKKTNATNCAPTPTQGLDGTTKSTPWIAGEQIDWRNFDAPAGGSELGKGCTWYKIGVENNHEDKGSTTKIRNTQMKVDNGDSRMSWVRSGDWTLYSIRLESGTYNFSANGGAVLFHILNSAGEVVNVVFANANNSGVRTSSNIDLCAGDYFLRAVCTGDDKISWYRVNLVTAKEVEGCTPAVKPAELVFEELTWEPANPVDGENVHLKVKLKNIGEEKYDGCGGEEGEPGTNATKWGIVFRIFEEGNTSDDPNVFMWHDYAYPDGIEAGASQWFYVTDGNKGNSGDKWTAKEGTHKVIVRADASCISSSIANVTKNIIVGPAPCDNPYAISLTSATGTNNQTKCINTTIDNITYSISNATGATVTGLPTGISGSYSAGVFTISGQPSQSGTFNYTITPSGGCGTVVTATGTIKINDIPTQSAITSQNICDGVATTAVNLTSTYTWTRTGDNIGGTTSGTGSIASFTPTTTGMTTYTVTPVANGCSGTAVKFTITVNAIPSVPGAPTETSICEGSNLKSLVPTNSNGDTWYWQTTINGKNETNNVTADLVATVGSTYYLSAKSNGCWSETTTTGVTVRGVTVSTLANQAITIEDVATPFNVIATPINGATIDSYQWYISNDGTTTNAELIAGEKNASYTPAVNATGSKKYFVAVAHNCGTTNSNIATVTVNPQDEPEIDCNEAISSPSYPIVAFRAASSKNNGPTGNYLYDNSGKLTVGNTTISEEAKWLKIPSGETNYYYYKNVVTGNYLYNPGGAANCGGGDWKTYTNVLTTNEPNPDHTKANAYKWQFQSKNEGGMQYAVINKENGKALVAIATNYGASCVPGLSTNITLHNNYHIYEEANGSSPASTGDAPDFTISGITVSGSNGQATIENITISNIGTIDAIAPSPTNPITVYVGIGGIWRTVKITNGSVITTNNSATYTSGDDFTPSAFVLAVGTYAVATKVEGNSDEKNCLNNDKYTSSVKIEAPTVPVNKIIWTNAAGCGEWGNPKNWKLDDGSNTCLDDLNFTLSYDVQVVIPSGITGPKMTNNDVGDVKMPGDIHIHNLTIAPDAEMHIGPLAGNKCTNVNTTIIAGRKEWYLIGAHLDGLKARNFYRENMPCVYLRKCNITDEDGMQIFGWATAVQTGESTNEALDSKQAYALYAPNQYSTDQLPAAIFFMSNPLPEGSSSISEEAKKPITFNLSGKFHDNITFSHGGNGKFEVYANPLMSKISVEALIDELEEKASNVQIAVWQNKKTSGGTKVIEAFTTYANKNNPLNNDPTGVYIPSKAAFAIYTEGTGFNNVDILEIESIISGLGVTEGGASPAKAKTSKAMLDITASSNDYASTSNILYSEEPVNDLQRLFVADGNEIYVSANDKKLQARAISNLSETVGLGVKSTNAKTVKLTFNGVENFDGIAKVYLTDKTTGIKQELSEGYEVEADLLAGFNADRFVISFEATGEIIDPVEPTEPGDDVITGDITNSADRGLKIYSEDNKNIVVSTSTNDRINNILVTNMAGGIVKNTSEAHSYTVVDMSGNAAGIYIVKVTTDKETKTAKIVIK